MKRSDKVLLGLLGALALLILLCAACVVAVVVLPLRWWSHGGAVEASKEFLASNPVVVQKIGKIERFGRVPSGTFEETNGRGSAHLTLTLHGEKGEAKATLDLTKEPGGSWKVRSATLLADGASLPLLGAAQGPADDGAPAPAPTPADPAPPPEEKDSEGLPA